MCRCVIQYKYDIGKGGTYGYKTLYHPGKRIRRSYIEKGPCDACHAL